MGELAAIEGAPFESFTILTTVPNQLMEPIHKRMPVIIALQDYELWLAPSAPQLLESYPATDACLVGTAINGSGAADSARHFSTPSRKSSSSPPLVATMAIAFPSSITLSLSTATTTSQAA
jgi:hypothetical protein